jgi:hypothetical protein
MALRQYHSPTGIIEREPIEEELNLEFEMKVSSPDIQMIVGAMAEMTGKTSKEVSDSLRKNYKEKSKA